MTDSRARPSRRARSSRTTIPIVRLLVVSVLAELGHETRACANGADAWRTFEEWLPELVVLDADLPIVDGVEICRRIREWDEKREVFVLFLTGRDHPEILDERARRRRRRVHREADDRRSICARGWSSSQRRMAQDAARRRRRRSCPRRAGSPGSATRRSRCSTRSTIRSRRCSATPS